MPIINSIMFGGASSMFYLLQSYRIKQHNNIIKENQKYDSKCLCGQI
jgi:hypothetical protein